MNADISPYFFQFRYREHWYPALLVNMPCNLETHKTFDNTTYYKCGDIGQVRAWFDILIVIISVDPT
jgi:TATA-binding protein-associated factor Taf7